MEQTKELPSRSARQLFFSRILQFRRSWAKVYTGGDEFRQFGREEERRCRKQIIKLSAGEEGGARKPMNSLGKEERGERSRPGNRRPRVMPPSRHTRSRHIVPHLTSPHGIVVVLNIASDFSIDRMSNFDISYRTRFAFHPPSSPNVDAALERKRATYRTSKS